MSFLKQISIFLKNYILITFLFITLISFTLLLQTDIARGLFFLLFVFLLFFQKNKKSLIKEHMSSPFKWGVLSLFFFYIINVIGITYAPDFKHGINSLETKLPLILCSFLFLIIPKSLFEPNKQKIYSYTFLFGCIIFAIISLLLSIFKIIEHPDFFPFAFYRDNLLFNSLHPTYISLFYVVAIIFAFDLLKKEGKTFKELFFLICSILFLISYCILLGSRAGITSLIIILLVTVGELLTAEKNRKLGIAFLIITSFIFFFAITKVEVVQKRMDETKYAIERYQSNDKQQDPRIALWRAVIPLLDNHLIIGYGTGSKSSLEKVIIPLEYKGELNDPHNQFLLTFLESGIIGLFFFLSIFITGFWVSIKKRYMPLFLFMCIFVFNCIFESLFERALGTLFFGFVYLLLLSFSFVKENN